MSIINKMLQDLEQRQAGENGAAGTGTSLSHVRVTPQQKKAYLAWTVAALSFAALLVVLLLVWLQPAAVVNATRRLAPQLILKPALSLQTVPVTLPASQAENNMPSIVQQASESKAEATTIMPSVNQQETVAAGTIVTASTDMQSKPAMQIPPVAATVPAFVPEEEKKLPIKIAPEAIQKKKQVREQKKDSAEPAQPRSSEKVVISGASSRVHQTAEPEQSMQENPRVLKKQIKPLTPQQQAENDARKALVLMQQGQISEAISLLNQALQLAPGNVDARQTLIAALLRNGNADQAMVRAQEGLALDIKQTGFAMILARLQIEKGQQKTAIATLQHSLPYAENQPGYSAFLAALLQREKRHKDAVDQYLQALRNASDNGVWWMGLGISLQAEKRDVEARQAFTRARESASLTPALQAFVEQKLKQLSP